MEKSTNEKWDASFDVVIVGSGAAGLSTALTAQLRGLSSVVIEKTDKYGGSTSLSGGALWIPNNLYLKQAGQKDTIENARTYLDSTVGDRVPEARKEAYLKRGTDMVAFFHEKTKHVRFEYIPGYSDYYPERPGGLQEGRSVEPPVFNLKKLGPELKNLRTAGMDTRGLTINAYEFHKLNMITRTMAGKTTALKVGMRLIRGKLSGAHYSSLGEALIGRLRLSLMDEKGEVWLSTPFEDLIMDNGKVAGVVAVKDGKKIRIQAKSGVVLASGGFSHNQELREEYLPSPTKTEWTSASPGQTGDVLDSAVKAGGTLDLMDKVWGAPSAKPEGEAPFFLVADRGIPGMIIVNGAGQRYLNEGIAYHEFIDEMYEKNTAEAPTIPSWMIIDETSKKRYMILGLFPGQAFHERWIDSGFIKVAHTPEQLAEKIDVPKDNLLDTIIRFNKLAIDGKDLDFKRGDSAYDQYYGDPTLKNPSLAPLDKGPYYALPVYPGDIGTKGGLVTDANARVIREDGTPIEGLYASGNCSASVMGESYPGPGATIGPAMTFGFLAASDMAIKKGLI